MTIRISVELSHICPVDDILEHSLVVESNGFYRVWVPDTVVSPWEAWMAASLIAQNTCSVKIGLGVTNPYTRHPMVAAQMAVTLQHISMGRLSLSLGKGIGKLLEKAGIEQHDTAVEEYIHILRGLMSGERLSYQGSAFQIDGIKLRTPVPKTPVPIYMAALGTAGWQTGLRAADGIATFWNKNAGKLRNEMMAEKPPCPTAALIPFSLTLDDFFPQRISSLTALRSAVRDMEKAGFDEVILGYGTIDDLKAAAGLIDY